MPHASLNSDKTLVSVMDVEHLCSKCNNFSRWVKFSLLSGCAFVISLTVRRMPLESVTSAIVWLKVVTNVSALIIVELAPAWVEWRQVHAKSAREGSQRVSWEISSLVFSFLFSSWRFIWLSFSSLLSQIKIRMTIWMSPNQLSEMSDGIFFSRKYVRTKQFTFNLFMFH